MQAEDVAPELGHLDTNASTGTSGGGTRPLLDLPITALNACVQGPSFPGIFMTRDCSLFHVNRLSVFPCKRCVCRARSATQQGPLGSEEGRSCTLGTRVACGLRRNVRKLRKTEPLPPEGRRESPAAGVSIRA